MSYSHYYSTRRIILAAAFIAAGVVSAMAQNNRARVDIASSPRDGINLSFIKITEGGKIAFTGDTNTALSAHFPATTKWQAGLITLRPDKSGRISLVPIGPWIQLDPQTKELQPVFIEYDNFQVDGAIIENGGFEESSSSPFPKSWFVTDIPKSNPPLTSKNTAQVLSGDAAEGKHYIRVWHNSRFAQSITVEAGMPITISFQYRLGK